MIKEFLKTRIFGNIIIGVLSFMVVVMLSSFISRMVIEPPVDSSLNAEVKYTAQEVIQINVLNACGQPGLASKVKAFLRARGFDVVEIGNYDRNMEKSVVIDRLGDVLSTQKVAYAVGVTDSLIYRQIDSTLFLRSTVVIGIDFKELKPFN